MTATRLVACPHCNTLNRVPMSRLAESPNCGKCAGALFVGHPLALDAVGFHAHADRADLPLLSHNLPADFAALRKLMMG